MFAPIWVTPELAWSNDDLDELTSRPMTSATSVAIMPEAILTTSFESSRRW